MPPKLYSKSPNRHVEWRSSDAPRSVACIRCVSSTSLFVQPEYDSVANERFDRSSTRTSGTPVPPMWKRREPTAVTVPSLA